MNWKENWRQIENKYPKAYALWMQFDSPEAKICVTYRDLYDFFDEQDIWIEVIPCSTGFTAAVHYLRNNVRTNRFLDTKNKWSFSGRMKTLKTRAEAEEAAFLKAFEILEEKLK